MFLDAIGADSKIVSLGVDTKVVEPKSILKVAMETPPLPCDRGGIKRSCEKSAPASDGAASSCAKKDLCYTCKERFNQDLLVRQDGRCFTSVMG